MNGEGFAYFHWRRDLERRGRGMTEREFLAIWEATKP